MAAIVVKDLTKRFALVAIPKHASLKELVVKGRLFAPPAEHRRVITAVDSVSFRVDDGSSIGIVGRNGSGKTTLLRLLAGFYTATSGSIKISGTTALLSLGLGFHPDMTGRENVEINGLVLGLSPRQIRERFDEIVAFAEMEDFIDYPVRTYSAGMYARLSFAIAVSVDSDVLLLDEILAVGDAAFTAKCLERIRRFKDSGKTIVLVTHQAETLREWCDVTLWMEHGRVRMFGPTHEVADAYHRDLVESPAGFSPVL